MNTLHACMIAGVALGLPLSASAQSAADSRYCAALANKYAGFVAATNQQRHDPQAISARAGIDLPRQAPTFIRVTHGHSKGG